MSELSNQILWYFNTGVPGFNYPATVLSAYQKAGASGRYFTCLETLCASKVGGASYAFVGAKYKSLMAGLNGSGVAVMGGWRALGYAALHSYRMQPTNSYCAELAVIANSRVGASEGQLDALVDRAALALSRMGAKGLVTINDSLPLERVWIAGARRARIRSFCVQHGLFTKSLSNLADGSYADYMLSFDESQKRLIESNPLVKAKVGVFGYHSVLPNLDSAPVKGKKRVACFLGQPWGEYYPHMREEYRRIVEKTARALMTQGIEAHYKPHPSERLYAVDKEWPLRSFPGGLQKAFLKFDAFLSVSSTALFEASLCGKVGIQIHCPALSEEKLESVGYAWTIGEPDLMSLATYIYGRPVPCPVHVCRNDSEIGQRFFKFVAAIDDDIQVEATGTRS